METPRETRSVLRTAAKEIRKMIIEQSRSAAASALSAILFLSIGPAAKAVEFSDWCPPTNLGPPINSTPFSDGGPAISKNGLSLYFHSNRSGNFDLYVSRRESKNSPWGEPQNLGPTINTASVETVPALSRDGHWLFFNAFNRPGGFGGFDIWASYRDDVHDDFAWQTPVNLGRGVNSPVNDVGPSYFENGEGGAALLFFGSNRPDPQGRGGRMDIYVSSRQADGSFGPAELVEELSSTANDVRPSIRFD